MSAKIKKAMPVIEAYVSVYNIGYTVPHLSDEVISRRALALEKLRDVLVDQYGISTAEGLTNDYSPAILTIERLVQFLEGAAL